MAQEADIPDKLAAADPETSRSADQDEVRARILRAAEERFIRYGFGKTTMAEIAADCGMSAGNLYRFFDNKVDIADAGARRWLTALETNLWAIARDADVPAPERLAQITHAKLDAFSDLVDATPHLEELIEHVCRERENVVEGHRATMRLLFGAVIGDGKKSGTFDIENSSVAAEAFQLATVGLFHHHVIWSVPFDKLRADADKIVSLLVRGLGKR